MPRVVYVDLKGGRHECNVASGTTLMEGAVQNGIDEIVAFFALGKPPHPPSHHMTNCWVREVDGQVLVKMKWLVPDVANGTFNGGD